MNQTHEEEVVRDYVQGWKEQNGAKVLSTLHPDCVLIESDGAIIRGAKAIIRSLERRIAGEYGPWKIDRWDINTLAASGELCFLEWTFEGRHSFEGASVVRFKDAKIIHLREYRTTQPLYETND